MFRQVSDEVMLEHSSLKFVKSRNLWKSSFISWHRETLISRCLIGPSVEPLWISSFILWQGKTNKIIPKPLKLEVNVLHVHGVLLPVLAGRVGLWVELAIRRTRSASVSMDDHHLRLELILVRYETWSWNSGFVHNLSKRYGQDPKLAAELSWHKILTTSDLFPQEWNCSKISSRGGFRNCMLVCRLNLNISFQQWQIQEFCLVSSL